jgi:serine protease Do
MLDSMKIRLPGPVSSAALLLASGVIVGMVMTRRGPAAKPLLGSCDGEYADSLQQLSSRDRDIENSQRSEYTYLIRSSARYECPYYGSDGKIRRRRLESVEHGTAFAYEVSNGETFLLTNEHVAAWPDVTDLAHRVEGVPEGCKRVEDKQRIVHDEHDAYEPGQIPLTRIAVDPQLDAAILKASHVLVTFPYRIGKSASLRQANAVQVRGFPLGLIRAVNTGKVVNPYDLDQEQGWNHVDFVTDALLSEGNSGSPVLALSCATGELQLVGLYHAGYKGHSALNVVVGIDQLREFMTKKRRVPRATPEGSPATVAMERKRLRDSLGASNLPLFEFGGLHVLAQASGDLLLYHVYGREFPLDDRRMAVLEDRPNASGAGEIARLWVRGETGLHEWAAKDLGAEERDLLIRLDEAVRGQMVRVVGYRRSLANPNSSDERRRGRELLRTIERQTMPARELAGNLIDLVERLGPARDNPAVAAGGALDAGVPAVPIIHAPRASEP